MSGHLAAAPPPGNPFLTNDFLAAAGLLVLALTAGAVAFALLERWKRNQLDARPAADEPLTLSSFRAMYERGELSKAEYERVRDKMAARMKGGPPKPVATTAPAAGPPLATGLPDTGPPPPADPSDNGGGSASGASEDWEGPGGGTGPAPGPPANPPNG